MFGGIYVRRPTRVVAAQYDGSIDSGDSLITWVKRSSGRQQLNFEKDTHLVLHGPDGTFDFFETWWLVYNAHENSFEVLTPEQFEANYMKQEEL